MGKQTPQHVTNPPEKRVETYERKRRAAEMRRKGYPWAEIASELGYADPTGAFHAVQALLKEHQSLAYDEIALYRQESLDRLTDLLKVAMEKALKGDEKMMREARLIISQMDDLTGTKAPVAVQIGESDVDRLLRDALEELERRAAEADRQAGAGAGSSAPDR